MTERSNHKSVRDELDARAKRALARRLPWPYNGMVGDITSAVQAGANYLAAAGLVSYTEICGRRLFFRGNRRVGKEKCFRRFLCRMGNQEILDKSVEVLGSKMRLYDVVRNGIFHEYFFKSEGGGVAMVTGDGEGKRTGFLVRGRDVWMVVVPFFNLFCDALRDAQEEGLIERGAGADLRLQPDGAPRRR